MLTRALAEDVFAEAVRACDPAELVRAALVDVRVEGRRLGLAAGKAALAMARGAGPVADGLVIAPFDDGAELPSGWRLMIGAHPVPDERSVAAGEEALELVDAAAPDDVVIALISGGASSLMEVPRGSLDELRAVTSALMAGGAPISTLNLVRSALSRIKGGGLVARCDARVVTLAISDVLGDAIGLIGSGPTIPRLGAPWIAAGELRPYGLSAATLDLLSAASAAGARPRLGDIARVIAPITLCADVAVDALRRRDLDVARETAALAGDVDEVAQTLALRSGLIVAWGEPTLVVPADHGEGGRAQQLALVLARALRGTDRAALSIGSDGIDGPAPAARPAPAGAFVDGTTWDAIIAAGLDPEAALARRDAGTALAAVGALVVTGPTGINHADLVILG